MAPIAYQSDLPPHNDSLSTKLPQLPQPEIDITLRIIVKRSVMVTMDYPACTKGFGHVVDNQKTIRMGVWSLMGNQDIRLVPLQTLNILGKYGTAMLAWQPATPEISFPAMVQELLSGGIAWRLRRIPDLLTKDPAKTRDPDTLYLYYPSMQVMLGTSRQVVVIAHRIRIMITVNKPDISQLKDGGEGLRKGLRQAQIT